jgi:hypothetical protein
MSLQTHITQAPAGETDVVLVRLRHEAWPTDLLYADDVVDWTVIDDESNSVTFNQTGLDADGEPTDDSGIDSRQVSVPDPNLVLWRRLEALSKAGDTRRVEVTVFRYLSSDLTEPAAFAILAMVGPSRNERLVSFEASNANVQNRDAPTRRYTYANSPGLRR